MLADARYRLIVSTLRDKAGEFDELIRKTKVQDIINASGRDAYHPVYKYDKAEKLIPLLSRGIHRVPVVNSTGELENIVSQSHLVKFIEQSIHKHSKLAAFGEVSAVSNV